MREVELFRDLRPDEEVDEAQLAALRRSLFPSVQGREHPQRRSVDAHLESPQLPRGHEPARTVGSRRSQLVGAAVVVAVALAGLVGLWALQQRDETPTSELLATVDTDAPPATAQTGVTSNPYSVPLVGFDERGWQVTRAADDTIADRRTVVFLSTDEFEGPWVEVTSTGPGSETRSTTPSGDRTVDVQGQPADVTEFDQGLLLQWTDPSSGGSVVLLGWQVDLDTAIEVARATVDTGEALIIDPLPIGSSLASDQAADALGQFASYGFAHPDGREVEVTLNPGGSRGLYQRQGPQADWEREGRTQILIGGQPATLIEYTAPGDTAVTRATLPPVSQPGQPTEEAAEQTTPAGGEYRVTMQRGFWTWEFNASGFASRQQIIDLVDGAAQVDVDTWQASLAENVIAPTARQQAIDQALSDIPLPPGFDSDQLSAAATEDRYQFIAEVTGAVACAWFNEWRSAQTTGDQERQGAAATALDSSTQWAVLDEIADQGGWSSAVWGVADYVNTNRGTATQASTPTEVEATLGCERFNS